MADQPRQSRKLPPLSVDTPSQSMRKKRTKRKTTEDGETVDDKGTQKRTTRRRRSASRERVVGDSPDRAGDLASGTDNPDFNESNNLGRSSGEKRRRRMPTSETGRALQSLNTENEVTIAFPRPHIVIVTLGNA